MQRISTICILGDYPDPIRDTMFINQYVKDGVMKIFKTKDIDADKEDIKKFILDNISSN